MNYPVHQTWQQFSITLLLPYNVQLFRIRYEQDMKCNCNVTLRRAGITIVSVEKPRVLHILSVCLWPWLSRIQSACSVFYCHLWPVWLYRTSTHNLINGKINKKKLWNIKGVFWFSLQRLSEKYLILRRIQRDIIMNVHTSSCKVPGILVRF
jgi:hypothetical protein